MSSRLFRATTTADNYLVPRRFKDQRDISPDRFRRPRHKPNRKVPVVYYLCRNGQIDHPHFMEVTLSSDSDGLYLKDVINRLNDVRGKGMASLYSWSSKRSYKNGFVWHDLSEDDFIFPTQGQEYVLKGSEVLDSCLISNPRSLLETTSYPTLNQDLSEYKVYKATESLTETTQRLVADASTQTNDRRRRRKPAKEEIEEVKTPASYEKADGRLLTKVAPIIGRFRAYLAGQMSCGPSLKDQGLWCSGCTLTSDEKRVEEELKSLFLHR